MRLLSLAVTGLAGLALGGCASSSSQSSNAGVPPSAAAAEGGSGAPVRWTGSFTPTSQRSGSIGGSDRARTYGNVTLTMSPTNRTRSQARLSLTVPADATNTSLPWSINPGRCGSGTIPIMALNLFPLIEVGGNGRAEINAELALATPTSGSFHVNVYWPGGSSLENVMACSNLRLE